MFIVDALLGSFDRHNGNWGVLVDEERQTAEIAPIYDCGSCLYPQLGIQERLSNTILSGYSSTSGISRTPMKL